MRYRALEGNGYQKMWVEIRQKEYKKLNLSKLFH